ncbi:MAG: iron ABC transporter permease [Chloroflexi bacterium]|nr:iron ABC transporter permease [Chloroflexota bacterium]
MAVELGAIGAVAPASFRERTLSAPWPPLFVLAPAVLVGAAMLLPLGYLIWRTLGAGPEAWDLLARSHVFGTLFRTMVLAATVTGATIAIGVPLAWLTIRTDLPLRRLWAVLTVLPLVIPSYVGGMVVVAALRPKGLLQEILSGPFGVDRLPEIYGFPGAFLTLALLTYPYVLLSTRAALWNVDPALEEASRGLGRGAWTTFRRVTLPQLRPAIAAGALLVALYTLSDFGAVSLLRFDSFTRVIFLQYESAFNRTLAAASSLVLVVLALGILLVEARARGRARYYRSGAGAARRPGVVRLGRWRWPALAFVVAVVALALAAPISVLGYWLVRGVQAGEPLRLVGEGALNSLYVSSLAAVATVVAALPVAILTVRYPSWVSSLLERVSYIGFALPGIAVALALVFFGARYATPVYQTLGLLVFAYVVLFLPVAVGALRASLQQVHPHVEEAARSLGRSPLRVFLTVTLPLMRWGILASAAGVFLITMKELPVTLILSPIGFKTLATSTWSAASAAFFAQAAAPALLLMLVSSVAVGLLMFREPQLRR